MWILKDSLAAGGTKRYILSAGSEPHEATQTVKVQTSDRALRIEVEGKPVLQYNIGIVPSDDPKEPAYGRSGFIHPIYNPSGQVVTEAMPPDHMHQHGLMFAWVNTTFEGRTVDFWNSYKHEELVRHTTLLGSESGPVFGAFTAALDHVELKAPGGEKVTLHETWVVHVYQHAGGFLFDLQSTQTCASESPLRINQNAYGGMAIRGTPQWFGKGKCEFLTGEGKTLADGNHTRTRWCEIFGTVGDHVSGIATLSHPSNYNSPQPLRLHPEKPYLCWAPMVTAPFSIEPANSYVSAYRLYIHEGKPNAVATDALWADYADPPVVRMVDGN